MAYWIDPGTYIDCGARAPECPVDAIFYISEDGVPDKWEEWIAKNRAFFVEGPGHTAA
jgi:hypothetical protein